MQPCFILIPYRYPVYFLDLFLDLSYAIDPSSDSVHGLSNFRNLNGFRTQIGKQKNMHRTANHERYPKMGQWRSSFLFSDSVCLGICCTINVIASSLIPPLLLLMPSIYQSIYEDAITFIVQQMPKHTESENRKIKFQEP
jgi:hypothetical protein